MSDPILPNTITTAPSVKSAVNTINPLSFLFSGRDYVPSWFINMFRGAKGSEWETTGAPAKSAHIVAKVLAGAGALGLGAWGARHLMHSMKLDAIDNANSAATAGGKL